MAMTFEPCGFSIGVTQCERPTGHTRWVLSAGWPCSEPYDISPYAHMGCLAPYDLEVLPWMELLNDAGRR